MLEQPSVNLPPLDTRETILQVEKKKKRQHLHLPKNYLYNLNATIATKKHISHIPSSYRWAVVQCNALLHLIGVLNTRVLVFAYSQEMYERRRAATPVVVSSFCRSSGGHSLFETDTRLTLNRQSPLNVIIYFHLPKVNLISIFLLLVCWKCKQNKNSC